MLFRSDVVTREPAAVAEADPTRLAELPSGTRVFGVPFARPRLDAVEVVAARWWGAVRRRRSALLAGRWPSEALPQVPEAERESGLIAREQVGWNLHTPGGWLRAWRAWRHHAGERAWARHAGAAAQSIIDPDVDRKSTRLNSSHIQKSRMPSSA